MISIEYKQGIVRRTFGYFGIVLLLLFCSVAIASGTYIFLAPVALAFLILLPAMLPKMASGSFDRAFFYSFCALVFFEVVWPRYAFIRLGAGPGINPQRIGLVLMFVMSYVLLVKDSDVRARLTNLISRYSGFFIFFGIYWFSRFFSCFKADFVLPSLAAFFAEFFYNGVFLFFAVIALNAERTVSFARLLMVATAVVVIVGFVEWRLQHNIFMNFFSIDDAYLAQVTGGIVRDSSYRVQSTFEHPLLFAEFLVLLAPIVLTYFFQNEKNALTYVSLFVVAQFPLLMYLTGSRSGVVALLVVASFMFFTFFYRKILTERKLHYLTVLSVVFAVVIFLSMLFSSDIATMIAGRSTAEASSSTARLIMLSRGLSLFEINPLLGSGFGTAAEKIGYVGAKGVLTVDSYLISVFVESGLFGFVGFVGMFLSLFMVFSKAGSKASAKQRLWVFAMLSSVFGFFAFKFILSLPHNFYLFYIVAVVLMCNGLVENSNKTDAGNE